jgi:hypothetical protein
LHPHMNKTDHPHRAWTSAGRYCSE